MDRRLDATLVAGTVVLTAVLAIPFFVAAQDGEEEGSAALKTLTTAQADFRSNDRDGNLVNDFWTADVYALYAMVPIAAGETKAPADVEDGSAIIKLIEPKVALADGASATAEYGNVRPKAVFKDEKVAAYHGYVFRAFAKQDDGAGATDLRDDTDGKDFYGKVHDRSRFGFVAAPEKLDAGRHLFIVNADNTIWRLELPKTYTMKYTPLSAGKESSSEFKCGVPELDDGSEFPASPGELGCRKHD